ncbi:hypothetical protein [Paenibacillus mesotrionivorans]|uniref:Uncharacterized protein n=1 Tax=Paenibacillus mesotrionivorans TaxID=3160968 RepID=A0ACC7NUV7_9BACL
MVYPAESFTYSRMGLSPFRQLELKHAVPLGLVLEHQLIGLLLDLNGTEGLNLV